MILVLRGHAGRAVALALAHVVHAEARRHHHVVRGAVDIALLRAAAAGAAGRLPRHLVEVLGRGVGRGHAHGAHGPRARRLPGVGRAHGHLGRRRAHLGEHHGGGAHALHAALHALLHALHAGVHGLAVLRAPGAALLELLLRHPAEVVRLLLEVDRPVALLLLRHLLLLGHLLLLHHGVALLLDGLALHLALRHLLGHALRPLHLLLHPSRQL